MSEPDYHSFEGWPNEIDSEKKLPLVSIVIPVFNEDKNTLMELDSELNKLCHSLSSITKLEVIFVDDSTSVTSRETVKEITRLRENYKAILFSRNFGKESALRAGMEFSTGDAVVPLDADLQDPLSVIEEMVVLWKSGIPSILAKRVDRKSDNFSKRFWSSIFYRTLARFSETPIPPNVGDFRLMDRKVVEAVLLLKERNMFMKGMYAWVGFPSYTIEYSRPSREFGKSKFPFRRLLKIGLDGLISFSSLPLRIWSIIGFLLSLISIAYSLVIVYSKLTNEIQTPGYASLTVIMLFSMSLNLFCFGIFGEYISRLFIESKQRPHFIVEETLGFQKFEKEYRKRNPVDL